MRQFVRKSLALALLLIVANPSVARAKEAPDHWNLGSIGVAVELEKGRVVVTSVLEDAPASGKIERGDIVVRVDGAELGKDPMDAIGRALDIAEKSGSLVLAVKRSGESKGRQTETPQTRCVCRGVFSQEQQDQEDPQSGVRLHDEQQQGGGVWHTYRDGKPHRGDGITTATVMSALGLMAVDAKKYKKTIKAATGFAMTQVRPR